MGPFNAFRKQSIKNKIIAAYYKSYPELPYISELRDENWIEMVRTFPNMLVSKNNMTRYSDGLLPGHVYLLYWADKYYGKDRKVPEYFEFEYGINYEREKSILTDLGYLSRRGKLTEKGRAAIKKHYNIIEKKHPSPKITGTENCGAVTFSDHGRSLLGLSIGTYNLSNSDFALISNEIEELKSAISKAKALAKIQGEQNISLCEIDFHKSFYTYHPVSGKRKSKYPLTLHFYSDKYEAWESGNGNPDVYFGEINYLQTGKIGDARVIFWENNNGLQINIRTKNNVTYIHDVQRVDTLKDTGKWEYLYKVSRQK